MTLKQSWRPC